ncbi:hypothetical protein ACFVKB_40255 [Rhodococcus sp. NPDC127530]|uniref:hypothetical protein n=1 Tax=unclassified Rhodococcus (in: high G+C Gram-positive bacteria) TaxID=192944 RepID=UPI00362CAAF6
MTAQRLVHTGKWFSMPLKRMPANFNTTGAPQNLTQALDYSSGVKPVRNRAADDTARFRLAFLLPGSSPPIPQHSMLSLKSGPRVAEARWSNTRSACIWMSDQTETDNSA